MTRAPDSAEAEAHEKKSSGEYKKKLEEAEASVKLMVSSIEGKLDSLSKQHAVDRALQLKELEELKNQGRNLFDKVGYEVSPHWP